MEWLWDDSPAVIGSARVPDADDTSEIARSVLAKAHRRVLKNESYGVRWSANRLFRELRVSGLTPLYGVSQHPPILGLSDNGTGGGCPPAPVIRSMRTEV